MLFVSLDGAKRSVVVCHPVHGTFNGSGETEAQAIEAAFSALRRATLPPALQELLGKP
jgi:hypothetical protein